MPNTSTDTDPFHAALAEMGRLQDEMTNHTKAAHQIGERLRILRREMAAGALGGGAVTELRRIEMFLRDRGVATLAEIRAGAGLTNPAGLSRNLQVLRERKVVKGMGASTWKYIGAGSGRAEKN